jgi:hypothetical protein
MTDPRPSTDLAAAGALAGSPAVDYTAFPLLDPAFPARASRVLGFIRRTYERIQDDDDAYCREAARLLRPLVTPFGVDGGSRRDVVRLQDFLNEADVYLCSSIRLLPEDLRQHLCPLQQVAECHDLRELLRLFFDADSPRLRYEAQRKICLARLLLDIEYSRHIQDGPLHKATLEDILQEALWRHTRQVHELEIGFRIRDDGETIEYTSRPGPDDQRWTFHSVFLEKTVHGRKVALDVLYYNCRFKRTVRPISFEVVGGKHRVVEHVRWSEMRQGSSGSILSKMIRKGISNPDEIADLIGAMFIVHDEDSLDDLLTILDASLGNPFGWRNVTDTLANEQDRRGLDRFSGRGYKVFKGDVDILQPGLDEAPPYRFGVELQIYTLESFLRTVCSMHEASHQALKLRQFIYGLMPKLFPTTIYGYDWLPAE